MTASAHGVKGRSHERHMVRAARRRDRGGQRDRTLEGQMMDMLLTVIFWGVLLGAFVFVIVAREIIDRRFK